MTGATQVHGADRLATTLKDAGAHLGDLTATNKRVGALVVARSRVPTRSGRLAGSLTEVPDAGGVAIRSSLVYAGPIHNGWPAHNIRANPFLVDAVQAGEPAILGEYVDAIDAAINQVRGA